MPCHALYLRRCLVYNSSQRKLINVFALHYRVCDKLISALHTSRKLRRAGLVQRWVTVRGYRNRKQICRASYVQLEGRWISWCTSLNGQLHSLLTLCMPVCQSLSAIDLKAMHIPSSNLSHSRLLPEYRSVVEVVIRWLLHHSQDETESRPVERLYRGTSQRTATDGAPSSRCSVPLKSRRFWRRSVADVWTEKSVFYIG